MLSVAIGCRSVTQADLVGHWTLTDGSRRYLPAELRAAAGRVNLESDGTFTAVELPEIRIESSGVVVLTRSGRGTWKIRTLGGEDNVQLVFAEGWGVHLGISTFLESEPKLYYFLDDPDSGQRLVLVRGQ